MVEQTGNRARFVERESVIDAGAPLILGFVAYAVAAFSTFSIPQLTVVGLDPFGVALFTSMAGLIVIGLGYASIVLLGGKYSLNIVGLIGRLTKTKQVIRPKEEENLQHGKKKTIIEKSYLVILPLILFLTSLTIGWDIYSADLAKNLGPKPGMLRFLLHTLNFLAAPHRGTGVIFSLTLIPGLIVITMISGLIPSIALPYFRRFKIIGINSGPFHSTLLTVVFGSIIGLNILVTILGIFLNVLWAEAPTSYHYALLVLVGFGLHYSAGTYLGRGKSESTILRRLANGRYNRKRIVVLDRTLDPNAKAIELRSLLRPQLED